MPNRGLTCFLTSDLSRTMSNALQRYEIKEKIAEGGLGSVSIAYDTQLERDVAIKRLHSIEGVDHEEMHEKLMKESRILSKLNSPNIVSLFDVGQDGDESFVVMEFIDGETLEEVVKRAPLLEKDFISVVEQSLEGIIAAHSGGLVHSDLKPENFMITWWPSGRFQLKLLDFGISSYVNAAEDHEAEAGGELLGSIYFMAPEQFKRKGIDQRTDIYSLGCVYYYALSGNYPFDGDTPAQVMASHLQNRFEPLESVRPDLDPRLSALVTHMIQKDPDHRFQSTQDIFEHLNEIKSVPYEETLTGPLNMGGPAAGLDPNRHAHLFAPKEKKQLPVIQILIVIIVLMFITISMAAIFMLNE